MLLNFVGLNFHEKLCEHFIEIMLQIQGQNTTPAWYTGLVLSQALLYFSNLLAWRLRGNIHIWKRTLVRLKLGRKSQSMKYQL